MRLQNLVILGGLIALGIYAGRYATRGPSSPMRRQDVADQRGADRRGATETHDRGDGRAAPARRGSAAGPRERWDKVDQASYESFPASDAPGY